MYYGFITKKYRNIKFDLYILIFLDTNIDCYSFSDLCKSIELQEMILLKKLNLEGNNIQNTGIISLGNGFNEYDYNLNYLNFNCIKI